MRQNRNGNMKQTARRGAEEEESPPKGHSFPPASGAAEGIAPQDASSTRCCRCYCAAGGAPRAEGTADDPGLRGPGDAGGSGGTDTHPGSNSTPTSQIVCKKSAGAEACRGLPSWAPLLLLLLLLGAALLLVPRELGDKLLLTSVASLAAFFAADLLMPVLGRKLMERGEWCALFYRCFHCRIPGVSTPCSVPFSFSLCAYLSLCLQIAVFVLTYHVVDARVSHVSVAALHLFVSMLFQFYSVVRFCLLLVILVYLGCCCCYSYDFVAVAALLQALQGAIFTSLPPLL